jgi:CheY-like chemotaxis protein
VWNLLRNAVKFTPPNGSIEVRTFNPRAGVIALEVTDSGCGIAQEDLRRIFQPFEQGKQRGQGGLGLGLSIARAIVSLHGGAIEVSSEGKDKGATFLVELSTCSLPPRPAPGVPSPVAARAGVRSLKILLVEDDTDTRLVLARMLKFVGHGVEVAHDVASAKEAATRFAPQLVISDLALPDGSGLDLMRHLKERLSLTGIAISGYGSPGDVQRSLEAGFNEHLTKPMEFSRLEEAIGRLCGSMS